MQRIDEIRERLGAADTDDYLDWRVIPRQYGPCEACGRGYVDHPSHEHRFVPTEKAHPPMVVAGDYVDEGEPDVCIEVVSEHEDATAQFIAHAPSDIRFLLDELDAAHRALAAAEGVTA